MMHARRGLTGAVIVGLLLAAVPAVCAVRAQDEPAKPRLSAAIRKALEDGGVDAAQRRFKEIYPSQKDRFEIDAPALMTLATERMTAGDATGGTAVMNMWMTVLQAEGVGAAATRTPPAASAGAPGGNPSARSAGAIIEHPSAAETNPGPPRTDLARFYGMYGDKEPSRRSVFVRETCDGHLQIGSQWGDASPWTMRSESDTVFVQVLIPDQPSLPPFRFEFELGPDGQARAVKHALTGEMQSVPRIGDLPKGWKTHDCGR
jgi:hypothetical protein